MLLEGTIAELLIRLEKNYTEDTYGKIKMTNSCNT